MKSIFSKIIDREAEADIVFENNKIIAIKDIAPKAPLHLLLITKKEIPSIQEISPQDMPLIEEIFKAAQHLAKEFKVAESGYRLVVNNGRDSGQIVDHLHFHLMAGQPLGRMAG